MIKLPSEMQGIVMRSQHPKDQPTFPKLAHTMSESLLDLSFRAQTLNSSATLAINEAVAQRRAAGWETIHLGFGEASLPLYPPLKYALAESIMHTSYAPVLGISALRLAIAEYLTNTRGIPTSPNHIAVGPGSKPLLYALLHLLEGDLLLPSPAWVSYAPQARLAGKRVIPVPTDPVDHHRLTPDALSKALATGQTLAFCL